MTEPPKPHTYALGTRVTFEDPTSVYVDYVTGEIVERLDDGRIPRVVRRARRGGDVARIFTIAA
jgi:hypothetical protein